MLHGYEEHQQDCCRFGPNKPFPLLVPVLLFLVLGTPVSAQTTVSVMAGLNRASLVVDTDAVPRPFYKSVKGMSVGVSATVPVSGWFGIQLGWTFSQKGGRVDVERVLESLQEEDRRGRLLVDGRARMSYLELALLARMGFPLSGERASGHLLAGPVLAWLPSCRWQDITFGRSYGCDLIAFDPKKYDVGVAAGGEIGMELSDTLDLGVGILYTLGILDISTGAPASFDRRNRTLTLRAGLSFPIG